MTLVIKSECIDVKDGACAAVCPVDCIYEGERMFYIHPSECIECGVCESVCPVDAIRFEDEIVAADQSFIAINREVFADAEGGLIAPGGWSRKSTPLRDHPAVATRPTKN
ncbi:4Fe-4S dicluster domain-containing protein [Rhizobium sp. C4]|uniref:4Fe-4S dicluster domain-containing protein n=1 Tax=Rhizobium sp. C4 TaxID=1349800 RepID=UPI001E306B6B|nr:ferredoxin family protein [Rhizobium sp. C4]MCD2175993.1 ferredoxin family protein [Rhizobium sp. C4]